MGLLAVSTNAYVKRLAPTTRSLLTMIGTIGAAGSGPDGQPGKPEIALDDAAEGGALVGIGPAHDATITSTAPMAARGALRR